MLKKIASQISYRYFQDNEDLEKQIAKYASLNNLNPHQIEDLTNRVNREVISGIQSRVPAGDIDPHFTFPTAKTAQVIAIMRPNTSQPIMPSTPNKIVVKPSLGVSVRPELRDRSSETIDSLIANPQSIPDRAVGIGLLSYMKNKLKAKVSKYNSMLIKMDSLMRSLEKEASSKLINGTPIEVINSLPIDLTKVANQVEAWGHKIKSIDQDFVIDQNDPFVKMANDFKNIEADSKILESDISKDRDEILNIERIVKGLK